MKTPKAEKMPSGNYRIRVQIDGKRYSVTAPSKKDAQEKAKKLYAGYLAEKKSQLTVGKAMDKYIDSKNGTLSPATINGYNVIRKHYFQGLMEIKLDELTQTDIQIAVSEETKKGKSAKTVKNAHGLLSATIKQFRPEFSISTTLPQKKVYEAYVPTEEEILKLWAAANGTVYYLPILLASWLGLRQSEIRGLKYSDIQDEMLHVQRAMVYKDGKYEEKLTKSVSGDRYIHLPSSLRILIAQRYAELGEEADPDCYICPLTASSLDKGFKRLREKAGLRYFRFHDLRHFAASEAHALGVPDKYAMKRMGHATDNMLKTVYQHTMKEKENEFTKAIDEKMEELFQKNG